MNKYEFDYTMDDKVGQLCQLIHDAFKHGVKIDIRDEQTFATDFVVTVYGPEAHVYAFILDNYDSNYTLSDMRELNLAK